MAFLILAMIFFLVRVGSFSDTCRCIPHLRLVNCHPGRYRGFQLLAVAEQNNKPRVGTGTLLSVNQSTLKRYAVDFGWFLTFCITAALVVVEWEDVTCSYYLPSRQRTSASLLKTEVGNYKWGASTVRGMGFGHEERKMLIQTDDSILDSLPSYNEIMLQHRQVTVPQWKLEPTSVTIQSSIHTVCLSLQHVWKLQSLASDYQWEIIRLQLRSPPLSDLPSACATLRQIKPNNRRTQYQDPYSLLSHVVGMDWGSCAWRHCGALADSQEAIDELEQLLGILEPYEAIFCLDIVERSLRDILAFVPWTQATDEDFQFYLNLQPYVDRIISEDTKIEDSYFKALQELRID